jgi:twitching motility protein PilT
MSSTKNPAIDRRAGKRLPARFQLIFRIAGRDNLPPQEAMTVDVSPKSLAFSALRSIPLETVLDIELFMPHHLKPVKFRGKVRRIEKNPEDKNYTYGLVIEEIAKSDQEILSLYVQTADLNNILRTSAQKKASDVHLVACQPPIFRIDGELLSQESFPLSPDDLRKMIMAILTERQIATFEKNLELDFSFMSQDGFRFRGNVHQEKGYIEVSFRQIGKEAKSVTELGLPPVIEELVKKKRGLILIAGPSGSGKSTTLTTMIDLINKQRKCMIISIEDPIEFVHQSKRSVIKQREVGRDTQSFNQGLKHVLRQDVDVILVGEMRDVESISMVITAAETGHLVLSTLHTSDSVEGLNRIIDAYPQVQQNQVRGQLAGCLEAIVTQLLLPRSDGEGRVLATEVLINNPAIRNLIRTGQMGQLPAYLEAGSSLGMHTMDNSLLDMARRRLISKETALSYARDLRKIQESL